MKKYWLNIILIIIFIIGLSLLIYPTVGNYINTLHQTQSVADYVEDISQISESKYEEMKEQVRNYNESLKSNRQDFINGESVSEKYKSLLNIGDNGMIGYITIDKMGVQIPIYHGTSETVLSNGVGHLEGSSLPLGGIGTHCVLTGHRGVPTSELFTNLDMLDTGDTFTITVLDELLTYEIDKISIVEPDDDSLLGIDENKDYVTLLTCTPYAVNTHRLLVRGKRIDSKNTLSLSITADAVQINSNLVALFIAVPALAIFILCVVVNGARAKHKAKKKHKGR